MKKIQLFIWLAVIGLFGTACDNEVDLTSDFKDIPVVYGLLSAQDTFHYVKIQKAFLPADGESALDVALKADSLYYTNLDVSLERVSNGETYPMTRIDGVAEGIIRAEGVFANQPNYLYKLELPIGEDLVVKEDYTLRINRGDNKPEITATTKILDEAEFNIPIQAGEVNIRYRDFSMTWRRADGTAFYDIKMQINFLEKTESGSFVSKTVVWNVEDNFVFEAGSPSISYGLDGEGFFQFLGTELEDRSELGSRIFESFDLIVDSGGEELFEYINVGQANTGITSSQVIPTYSNLSEGFGLFSSRSRSLYEGFTLQSEARDSLANGIYTRNLGFDF